VAFEEGSSRVSGTLYLMGQEHCRLLNDVYASYSHTNPMHADVFPSVRQMELEVVAMTAAMLGGALSLPCCLPSHASSKLRTNVRNQDMQAGVLSSPNHILLWHVDFSFLLRRAFSGPYPCAVIFAESLGRFLTTPKVHHRLAWRFPLSSHFLTNASRLLHCRRPFWG
jgi:hypothetical protein